MQTIGFKNNWTKKYTVNVIYNDKHISTWLVYAISPIAALESVKVEYEKAYGSQLANNHIFETMSKKVTIKTQTQNIES